MQKKINIHLLLSLIFVSTLLSGVCFQRAEASCNIDPNGTYIEAEDYSGSQDLAGSPTVNTRFQEITMTGAKGGKVLKAGSSGYAANTPGNEVKEYEVYFSQAGTYYMWMRGIGYNGSSDSIFFTIDDDAWKAWSYGGYYNSFVWTKSMQVGSNNTITVTAAGYHTLKIAMREAGSVIDGFFITQNYYYSLSDTTVAGKTAIDPSAGCSGALWTLDSTTIEASCYKNYDAVDITFTITNSGVSDDTSTGTVTCDSSWLSVADPVPALGVGESHTVTVTFDSSSLSVGAHTGVITFTSSGATVLNAPLAVTITMTVQAVPATSSCGSIPLFAENIVSPAIMVQLDTSGSMSTSMSVGGGQYKTRIAIAEAVLAQLFQDQTIEWGFATWAGGNGYSTDDGTSSNYYTTYRIGCHTHDDDHQTALQDKADDGNASGNTPLVPSMRAGLQYFQANRKDSYYQEYFTQVSCQPRILVIITDGEGNTGTSNTKIDAAMQNLIDEGITVVAVGFGLTTTTQLDRIVQKMQTAGEASEDDYLYHLHKENAAGTAVPFMAQNEAEFIAAMTDIVSGVKAQMFHGASPALSTSATDGAILLEASFDATDWTGNLSATKFNSFTGELEASYLWKAASVIPATINGFLYDSTAGSDGYVSKYTDASIAGDNFLCKKLGDIINSAPAIVSSVPPYYYKFNDYFTFKYSATVYNRDAMVYIGANDGALHAFRLEDGVEKWRFYPDAVVSKLANADSDPAQDMCSPSYCHKFLLDGSPELADIYVDSTTGWRTILTTGLGLGGSAFFSLDITHGEDFDAADDVKSTFLWEFTDTELGLATSDPVTARVSNGTSSTGWATFFGSGETEVTADQSNKEAYLFAVGSYDKSSVWVDTNGNDTYKVKLSSATLLDDKTSSPLVVDTHHDDYIYDNIYLGNLYGNLYRVSEIGFNEVPDSDILFNSANTDHSTPVSATPAYAYDSDGNLWVYFGTGQYSEQIDKVSTGQQYFYALYDKNAAINDTGSAPYILSNLVLLETDIIEAYSLDADGNKVDMDDDGDVDSDDKYTYRTVSCSAPDINGKCNPAATHPALTDEKPWAIKLYTSSSGGPSERIITQPLITSGIVFIVTFVPDGDVCAGNGDAWILAVDWETGQSVDDPVFDINGDGIIDDADKTVMDDSGVEHEVAGYYLGGGKPSSTIAIYGQNIAVGGTAGLLSGEDPLNSNSLIRVNLPDQKTKLKSWQQDFN
ncbi:PilC/PilY family type IV pilus protein [uncultured Desulfobacter sp.]|uniref:PilC/PilY family type IV pilus protein n=1 Tax=uncultured Desulfobacter sp. TaxID=240139 RepID=UPI002AAB48C3|nr:PilC/PilY family type IV pilus protein [uncultured Desulfobacter sp.]